MVDSELFKATGLRVTEFAKLAKVSRVTVNNWLKQVNQPSVHLAQRIENMMRVFRSAVNSGDLPVKETGKARFPAIVAVLRKHNT